MVLNFKGTSKISKWRLRVLGVDSILRTNRHLHTDDEVTKEIKESLRTNKGSNIV